MKIYKILEAINNKMMKKAHMHFLSLWYTIEERKQYTKAVYTTDTEKLKSLCKCKSIKYQTSCPACFLNEMRELYNKKVP